VDSENYPPKTGIFPRSRPAILKLRRKERLPVAASLERGKAVREYFAKKGFKGYTRNTTGARSDL